ncbi:hypothetical protein DNTS_026578, partial [Danionella cerebrum]
MILHCVRAPTLKFTSGVNPNNIALHTLVELYCDVPWQAPYPLIVSIGKLENTSQTPDTIEAWVSSEVISSSSMFFKIPATSQFEGKVVCWYKSTKSSLKNPYSAFTALSPPNITVNPNPFLHGGNYTVYCNTSLSSLTNFTLSLFYRILPVTPGTNWTSLGSMFFTGSIYARQTNVVIPVEYGCTIEMLYNGKVLKSPLAIEKAIPETFPVRLWEKDRGESCLGDLEINFKLTWTPVCQSDVNAEVAATTASVVCRELGCGQVMEWKRLVDVQKQFRNTIGNISCNGEETKIKDCKMNVTEWCNQRSSLYIVCSDALPGPELSVVSYGLVSKLYISEKQDVELLCTLNLSHLGEKDYGYYILRRNGQSIGETYGHPHQVVTFRQYAPVQGEYECAFQLYSSKIKQVSRPSNTVLVYIYVAPDPVPIVAGVLTTLTGVAILVYICVYRTSTE